MKRTLFFICTLLCVNMLWAQDWFWVGDLQYEVTNSTTNQVEVYDAEGTKTTYIKMDATKAVRVINEHIVNGNIVTEFTIGAAK